MDYRLMRVMSGALVVICAAAPGSADVMISKTPAVGHGPANQILGRGRLHSVRIRGSDIVVPLTLPSGCRANGPSSIVGEHGGTPATNFAGGGTDRLGFSGVVAGVSNLACDGESVIGGGSSNVIGGDGKSQQAFIGGGDGNTVEGALWGFIGAGLDNSLALAAPYNSTLSSSIVGGLGNTIDSPQSFVGGGFANTIAAAQVDPSGNGQSAFIGAGFQNTVSGNFGAIVAGEQNTAAGQDSAVLGGEVNIVDNLESGVLDGLGNDVSGEYSAIVDGFSNQIGSGSDYSFIGGGQSNSIPAVPLFSGQWATIGGGFENKVSGYTGTIGGGHQNVAGGGAYTVVGGGYRNSASGTFATVPGGENNSAQGENSFAAGTASNAATKGSFVWSDFATGSKALKSTAANQFLTRASGGYLLYSSATLSTGVKLAAGSGSWSSVSDRAAKTGVERIDDARILAKVAALPVSEWSYTAQGTGVRHLGPMAQDFRAAFGLGEDDRHISVVDEEGVALAAIKALQAKVAAKDRDLSEMRRTDDIKLARLEQRLEAVEQTLRASRK